MRRHAPAAWLGIALLALALIYPVAAGAQRSAPRDRIPPATAKLTPLKVATFLPVAKGERIVVPAAKLMRVDEGVFELEFGKTIDLTDRKILLSIGYRGRRKECCTLRINGRTMSFNGPGTRIDLKRERHTAGFVEDKSVCFLDIVDIALPRGTNGIATFRLHCI